MVFLNLRKKNLWKSPSPSLLLKEKGSQGSNLKIVLRHMRVLLWGSGAHCSAVRLWPWVAREVSLTCHVGLMC